MSVKTSVGGVLKSVSEIHTSKSSVIKAMEKGHCRVSGVTRQFFGKLENIDSFEIVLYRVSVNKTSNGTASSITIPTEYGTHTWGNASLSIQSTQIDAYAKNNANIGVVAQAYLKFTNGTRVDVRDIFTTSDSYIILKGNASMNNSSAVGGCGTQGVAIFGTKAMATGLTASNWTRDSTSVGTTTEDFLLISCTNCSGSGTSKGSIKSLSATVDDVSYPVSIVVS